MNVEPIGILRGLTTDEKGQAIATAALEIKANGLPRSDVLRVNEHSHALVTALLGNGESGKVATAVARIAGSVDGRLLVDGVDWPEGTAILSLDAYEPADYCVFTARDCDDLAYPADRGEAELLDELIREASRFHGETCAGVILGAKVMLHMMQTWQVGQKDPRLRLWLGSDGCIADALIALSGATLGTGRLKVPGGRIYRFVLEDKGLAYYPNDDAFAPAVEVLYKNIEDLFAIREESERSEERKPVHDKRPPRHPKEQEALVEKVRDSLVDGKLSCAVAYKIADEMGVHILDVGQAADVAKVKISHCQLGCFR